MVNKKTKIICTIGPSSWDRETLTKLFLSGMDIARLNFSHGTHEEKRKQINLIRNLSNKLKKRVSIMADLQGPKLRLGYIANTLHIKKGDVLKLSFSNQEGSIPIQFDFSSFIAKGQRVFLNDGLVELIVIGVKNGIINLEALNDGWISSNKGINLPDTHLNNSVFTPKDKIDAEFAILNEVDFLALSFVQTPQDIEKVKSLISSLKANIKIIAKIERNEAIQNLEGIVKVSDALMVARGDLAVETKSEEVPLLQKKIIRLSRQHQKPVIIATQMLESMIQNPRPTQAEVSDVATAVIEQADCVMLSSESASGKYPIEAVKIMREIILTAEKNSEYKKALEFNFEDTYLENLSTNAISASAENIAKIIGAKTIIVATSSGRTARLLASFRPNAQILAAVHDEKVCNQLNLVWGVNSFLVKPIKNSDIYWKNIIKKAKSLITYQSGEKVVLVGGTKIGTTGATNIIKIITL